MGVFHVFKLSKWYHIAQRTTYYFQFIFNLVVLNFILTKRLIKNFLGQWNFLGIRALLWTFMYNTRKRGSAEGNFHFILLETLKNYTLSKKFNS